MYPMVENQEISKSVFVSEDISRANYYETLNTRTYSSLDNFGANALYLNFIKKRNFQTPCDVRKSEYADVLSNQNDVLKIELPVYFSENRNKIISNYKEITQKGNFDLDQIEKHLNILTDNISELNFKDIYLEITKSNLIKFSTLFDDNKILIISKDFTEDNNDVVFSYFINSQMIATDVFEISTFIKKFKKYISL